MSIGGAARDVIGARGLRPADVADRLGGVRNRATFYRILSDETKDPRTGTLLELCSALAITPDELLQLAELYRGEGRQLKLIDVQLRQAIDETELLDDDDKRLCLALLRAVIDVRAPSIGARPRRRLLDRTRRLESNVDFRHPNPSDGAQCKG
jgi:transcriptional regulator with XRE-family HTH domain